MEGGRALRAGARLAALAVRAGAFAAVAACSPLELDLTDGEAGPPDSTAPDVTLPHDATIGDTGSPEADGPSATDSSSADANAEADVETSAPPIPCARTADCAEAGTTPLCDKDSGVCVECLTSANCGGNTPHCIDNVCIACMTSADCSDGGVCNRFVPRCASPCTTGANCTQSGQTGTLYCNQSAGYCVECTDNSYCATSAYGTYCYLAAGVCGCQTPADCPLQMPTCGPASPTGNRFCQK